DLVSAATEKNGTKGWIAAEIACASCWRVITCSAVAWVSSKATSAGSSEMRWAASACEERACETWNGKVSAHGIAAEGAGTASTKSAIPVSGSRAALQALCVPAIVTALHATNAELGMAQGETEAKAAASGVCTKSASAGSAGAAAGTEGWRASGVGSPAR